MPDRMKHLSIKAFRGATQPLDLPIDDSKPVVLIFGENGTGKSTIVDAIECVGAGTTSFLDDWKLGKGKRKEPFIPALGKSLVDVEIDLVFGDKTYNATLNQRGLLRLCLTENRPHVKVLRRKSLQAFIDADPAQRYREVAAFLDIPEVESAEESLRAAFKESQKRFELATHANAQALEHLQGLWEAEGSPGLDKKLSAESWARAEAEHPLEALQSKLAKLKAGIKHCENLTGQASTINEINAQFAAAQKVLKQREAELNRLQENENKDSAQLVTLLQDAKEYLSQSPDELCPVCEQTRISAPELVKRLEARIREMERFKQAVAAMGNARRNVQSCQDQLAQSQEKLLNMAEAAQKHFYPNVAAEQSIQSQRESDREKAIQFTEQLHSQLLQGLEALNQELSNAQKQLNNLSSIKQTVKILDEKAVEAKRTEKLTKKLQLAVAVVEEKRKAYVMNVLADIGQEVDSLYQQIHPQEEIGELKLKLDDNQRGSLLYGVTFGGQKDIHPQPYYSESHLDTLGLCIFLALAKRGDASRTLVLLDDVLGSVDQQHLQKTLDMLLGQSESFAQMVITTHYRPLRDQFRFNRQPTTPVQVIELKRWDFDRGIKLGKAITYVEELRQELQQEDMRRDVVASQAGRLFESLLEFISQTYRCRVPHLIEPRFTFGDLANAPNKKLKDSLEIKKLKPDGEQVIPLAPIYANLGQAINIRNLVGCHFYQWAGELADQNVREMGELALQMADALICEHCGSLPVSNKSGKYFECSCKKTQMHPLQQPN